MGSIAFHPADVIVGVDTHKHQHVGVALDGLGRRLGQRLVPATPAGYAELLTWATGLGRVAVVGVEGSGSYGLGLARFLRRHDVAVLEVARPPRKVSAACRARATRSMPSTPPARSSRAPAR